MPAYSRNITRPEPLSARPKRASIRQQVREALDLQLAAYAGTMADLEQVGFGSVTVRIEVKDGLVLLAAFVPEITGKPREWAAIVARRQEQP